MQGLKSSQAIFLWNWTFSHELKMSTLRFSDNQNFIWIFCQIWNIFSSLKNIYYLKFSVQLKNLVTPWCAEEHWFSATHGPMYGVTVILKLHERNLKISEIIDCCTSFWSIIHAKLASNLFNLAIYYLSKPTYILGSVVSLQDLLINSLRKCRDKSLNYTE